MTRYEYERAEAHALLDRVRLGEPTPIAQINRALRILGDLIGLRQYTDDGQPILVLERRS